MLTTGILKVLPFLIEINKEHEIIAKTRKSMSRRHRNDESEQIINEGIECLRGVKVSVNDYGERTN